MEDLLIAKELLFKTKLREKIKESIESKVLLSRGDILNLFNDVFDKDEIFTLLREEVEANVNDLYKEATEKVKEKQRDKSYTYRLNKKLLNKQFTTYVKSAYSVYIDTVGEALNELDKIANSSYDANKQT